MINRFQQTLQTRGIELRHTKTEILQINVGKLCNLTCNHCHVNAGPTRYDEKLCRQSYRLMRDFFAETL